MRVLGEHVPEVVDLASSEPGPVLREMDEHGQERSFPTVGPAVGRTLRLLARLAGARRVFEFGSGFGYSAAWFLGALPDDGGIVLTDYEADNLATAREFLGRLDSGTAVRYEAGDAMETFGRYDGPFEVVLIDHDKARYAGAFEMARPTVPVGGLFVADNILAGPVTPESVRTALEGGDPDDDHTAGVAAYIEQVRDDPAFETTVLPLGEGIAVSQRVE
jgi:predicted O-methyltransferase YrrM